MKSEELLNHSVTLGFASGQLWVAVARAGTIVVLKWVAYVILTSQPSDAGTSDSGLWLAEAGLCWACHWLVWGHPPLGTREEQSLPCAWCFCKDSTHSFRLRQVLLWNKRNLLDSIFVSASVRFKLSSFLQTFLSRLSYLSLLSLYSQIILLQTVRA